MSLRIPCFPFVLLAASALSVDPAYSQQQYRNTREEGSFRVRLETSVFWSLWDDSRNELITSSGSQYPAGRTATLVNIYNVVSGKKRSVDIPKEFPNARYISVDALAVGPEGSVLVACEVNSDNGAFAGENLLLYDSHSSLITGLTATGYDVGAVAVDEESSIYVVGTHDGESSSDESYPLIVEYDSRGRAEEPLLMFWVDADMSVSWSPRGCTFGSFYLLTRGTFDHAGRTP